MNLPRLSSILLVSLTVALTALTSARADDAWQLDGSHTSATFSVTHMGVSRVRGDFTEIGGTGKYDGKNIESASVEAVIAVASIDTRNSRRDGHLKGADFFDASKFPTITFKSKRFRPTTERKFQLTGDLTIHGVTKTVVLSGQFSPVIKDPFGKTRVGAEATTTINRKDFGLTWSPAVEGGGIVVGEDVDISIAVEFVKP